MNDEKEMIRHDNVMNRIQYASKKDDVPNITASTLSNFLANFIEFDGVKLNSKEFANVYQAIIDYGHFAHSDVKDMFIDILKKNYPNRYEYEYFNQYFEVAKNLRFHHIVQEITARYLKLTEIKEREDLEHHNQIMHRIKNCFDIKELPKVSRAGIATVISNATKTNYSDRIKNEDIYGIVHLLMDGYLLTSDEVENELLSAIKKHNSENVDEIFDEIMSYLLTDNKLKYLIEEVSAKEKRLSFIYQNDHELVMEQIHDARRISQLPKGYSMSTITGYLSGNSMIYSKGKIIPPGEFVTISHLLMEGKNFNHREILDEITRIVLDYYPDKVEEAFSLLLSKLSHLPKIYYIAEEVSEILKKQNEFAVRGASNVNVYFVPNPKSPIDGGKFYNCYISRAKNLNLEDILPLKLEDIVPPSMDIDSIEWYVQEKYDPTFKTAGGIILNKDEEIGNVTVFQPSDGKIGITKEEKDKYDELEDLSERVKEIIAKKKRETSEFVKLQQAFLLHQEETDKELSELETRIHHLTKKRGSR